MYKKLLTQLLILTLLPITAFAEDEIVAYKLNSDNGLPDNNIRIIRQDSLGRMVLKGRYAAWQYDGYSYREIKQEEWNNIRSDKETKGNRPGDVFRDNRNNRVELLSNGQIIYTDGKTGRDIRIQIAPPGFYQLTRSIKCCVITDKNRLVWVCTNGYGLYVYNLKEQTLRHITKDDPERLIDTNYLVDMEQDRNGNIWVSGEHHGISFLKVRQRDYRVININPTNADKGNEVRMLHRLANGTIIVSTASGQLFTSDDELHSLRQIPSHGETFIDAFIDSNGRQWLGSRTNGITVDGRQYGEGRVDCIVQDRQGRIWTCGLRNSLKMVSIENGQYRERVFMDDIKDLDPRTMLLDHRGDIWLGTLQGLFVFTPDRLAKNPKDYTKVMNEPVMCLYESSEQHIWVGTLKNGVYYGHNKKTSVREFTHVSKGHGLANNMVRSISEDNKKTICVGTEEGCSFIKTLQSKIYNLYFSDNRLRSIFNERCAVRLKDGKMAFGTLDGIVVTDKVMEESKQRHPVMITGLEVNGFPVGDIENSLLNGDLSLQRDITLNYDQSAVTLSFSNLNYGEQKQTIYMCQMEGYDKEWFNLGEDNTITFKRLNPGTYTFHVKCQEVGGISDAEECSIKIVIRSPWWRTWWALVLYLLIAVGLGFFIYKYLRDRYRLKRDIEVERQLTDYKLRFFTNITHEFRTPLTLIQGAMERIGDAKDVAGHLRQPLSNMQHSVDRLLRLVNQLLEFRRMQNNKLSLSLQETDIVAFLRNIFMTFHDVADNRHINYTFNTNQKSLTGYIDRGHVDKIVFNLLSNAFKYTPMKGDIELSVKCEEGRVTISVKDSGIGVPKEKQAELFNRFSTAKAKADSLGIGLNLTKELVYVHHGDISYKENTPQGSIFTLWLPIRQEDYRPEDFMAVDTALAIEEERTDNKGFRETYRDLMPEPMNDCQVLVVEDDIDVAEMLSRELGTYFHVTMASDGQEAMELLRSEGAVFDLVVSDVMMPQMNGFELTKAIRADQQLKHLPVVLLTALSSEEKQERGMTVGADAYVTKPFSLRLLISQCVNLLNQRQRLKSAYATLPQQKETAIPEIIKEEKDRKFIDKLNSYLYNHIKDEQLSVDVMAEHFGYGRTTFYNKVRDLTGFTPNEYLRDIRLSQAAQMLKDEDNINVSEVSYQVGFSNPQYFATSFKKKYGMTPKEYQRGK